MERCDGRESASKSVYLRAIASWDEQGVSRRRAIVSDRVSGKTVHLGNIGVSARLLPTLRVGSVSSYRVYIEQLQ